ncbi:MAG: long-chain fatty acid--CoA ligase, partial [Candidatus Electrothrix sp. MAN1_4]|nr:long-chain fatty acid--CoA ligase [Candidatus Electrothrix sp. MAN1_4]
MTFNLSEQFAQRAAEQPEHPLILGPGDDTCITYRSFSKNIRDYSEKLHNVGIQPGMNIGLHCPNGSAYIAYTYALWACGACVTPIPVELADQEKQHLFQYIALDGVITAKHLTAALEAVAIDRPKSISDQACYMPVRIFREPPQELAALNPAFIRFTSGTTGTAKGVVLSHETIRDRIMAANRGLCIGTQDRILWLLSMAYHFAVSICAYLSFGATIIFPKNAFGISMLQAAVRHQATLIYGAPTHYELMTHGTSGQELPPLRLAVVTTSHLRQEVADTFFQRFGIALNETYGLIELGLPAVNLEH